MISPIGSLMLDSHTMLESSIDRLIVASVEMARGPAVALFVLGGIFAATRMSFDARQRDEMMPYLIRATLLLVGTCTLDIINQYARDGVFQMLPVWISTSMTAAGANLSPIAGAQSTAAAFDASYAQMWIAISHAQAQASSLDLSLHIAIGITEFVVTAILAIMAFTYTLGEWSLAALVVVFPVVCLVSMLPVYRDVLSRWAGKVLSIGFVLFFGIITLQLVLSLYQEYFDRIIATNEAADAAIAATGFLDFAGRNAATAAAQASNVQALVSMVIVSLFGFVLMYALPALAYSLGSGIAMPQGAAVLAAAVGLQKMADVLMQLPRFGGGSPGAPNSRPNLAMSLAPKSIGFAQSHIGASGTRAALPPPPAAPINRP